MKYYFYRKTIAPKEYDYYNGSHGVVGYRYPREGHLLHYGTIETLYSSGDGYAKVKRAYSGVVAPDGRRL